MVVEYDGGRAVAWLDTRGRRTLTACAVKSPLTGAWLMTTGVTEDDTVTVWDARVATLRQARRLALSGNGRRYGGHASVNRVVQVPMVELLNMVTQTVH